MDTGIHFQIVAKHSGLASTAHGNPATTSKYG